MSCRDLTHTLLLGLLLATAPVSVASACAPTQWLYDTADLPSCVTLVRAGVHGFEVRNDCPDALVLTTTSDCPLCALPEPIPAGEVDLLDLGGPPAVQNDTVEVGWETGATTGIISFSFPINRCPGSDGCVAAPGASSGAFGALALVLGSLGVRRSRRASR